MFKKFVAAVAALLVSAAAFAAVDANKATQAELESIKGIGPAISTLIISERKKGDFKDWNDLVVRVKGVGDKNAAKFSTDGLTVNGAAFAGAPAAAKTEKAIKAEKPNVVEKAGSSVAAGAGKAKDKTVQAAETVKGKVEDKKAEREEKKAAKQEKKAAEAKAAGDDAKAAKAEKKAAAAKSDAADSKAKATESKQKASAAAASAAKK